jgi:AmmeMemoRadiSam system protein A
MQLSDLHKQTLLELARNSIQTGLDSGEQLFISEQDYDNDLLVKAACFVTLTINKQLRGCIGHLEAIQSLVKDVAENAFSAAFRDPRFPGLKADELPQCEIEISVLTPPEPMSFSSEEDLLEQIQPGKDGLILEDGFRRGTFLPSVWESLPEKQEFWKHLKLKAGLPIDHWSDNVKVARYHSLAFSEDDLT